jgi:UDP-N-acetylglucosamine 2-epimerase (non-hydrolysing)
MKKIKILTIAGTRPEWIRLCRIIPKLDNLCDHILVHTGQNYDYNLNDIFFKELGLRQPDEVINSKADTFGAQIGNIFREIEPILLRHKPDKVLILGDTNTSAAAFICERLGFSVYHMEAGNRCWDRQVPEEINRRMIDAVSSYNLPYTSQSKEYLIKEGFPINKIFETGNPIYEVLEYYKKYINNSNIHKKLNTLRDYNVLTLHRAECVDNNERLSSVADALKEISKDMPIYFSCHPRTKKRLEQFNISFDNSNIKILDPMGFFDWVSLQQYARVILTDSGTVNEEACLLKVPSVSIRASTERPETVKCGANIISGYKTEDIIRCYNLALNSNRDWEIPVGYLIKDVSDRVVKFLLSNQNIF